MDVQLVVGLCCLRDSPEAVSVVIGDDVYDSASETERDVDVTVKTSSRDGAAWAFAGYEVKDEKGALHVDDVEQLCVKLNDMPLLTKRAIVSSRDYSESARKKAAAHAVELYVLHDWQCPTALDPFAPGMRPVIFENTELRWVGGVYCQFNTHTTERSDLVSALRTNVDILADAGSKHPIYPNVHALLDAIQWDLRQKYAQRPEGQMPSPNRR